MLVDSHCHLDFPDFADDRAGFIARAEAGVTRHGNDLDPRRRFEEVRPSPRRMRKSGARSAPIRTMPARKPTSRPTICLRLANTSGSIAIGEAGLDYFYDKAPRDAQAQGFAPTSPPRGPGLPLVIHARDADDDMAAILEEETGKGAFPFVLHCFSSGRGLAETGVKLGGYVSFSGILTFKKSEDLRAIARDLPRDRLLVETDAPYLAPMPHRGKRNEPAYVAHTARAGRDARRRPRRSHGSRPTISSVSFRVPRPRIRLMPDRLRFTILGCGSSPGAAHHRRLGQLRSGQSEERRMRASAMVERIAADGGTNVVVVDTGPDFRVQMLNAGATEIDAAVYTHPHADHIHGIDDLRGYRARPAPPDGHLRRPSDAGPAEPVLRLLLPHAAGQFLSADPQRPHTPSPMTCHSRSTGRGRRNQLRAAAAHPWRHLSLGYRIGGIAYCPT
jgi:TatD DNase family protein